MPSCFQDLLVWRKAMDFTEEVYRLTQAMPKEELYGLTSQLRRAAVSIPSNIAEGHGRTTNREFCTFLSYAKGSACEAATQLMLCVRLGYLRQEQVQVAASSINEIESMLNVFIMKLAD